MFIKYSYLDNLNNFKIIEKSVSSDLDTLHLILPELHASYCNEKSEYKFYSKNNTPSILIYDDNNNLLREEYYENGVNHRLNGPSVRERALSSDQFFYHYYINGSYFRYANDFAIKTNHIICDECNDFCNQNCFF